MTLKIRTKILLLSAFFFGSAILFLAGLFSSKTIEPNARIIMWIVVAGSLIFFICGLLFAFLTRLIITEEGLYYWQILNEKFIPWGEIDNISVGSGSLCLRFNLNSLTPSRKLSNHLFGDQNEIVVSNFIKDWQLTETWKEDPLLSVIGILISLREKEQAETDEEFDEESE